MSLHFDVYKKILTANKGLMIVSSLQDYIDVLPKIRGSPYVRHFIAESDIELAQKAILAR